MKKKQTAPKPSTGSKRTPSSKALTSSTDSLSKSIRIDRPFPLPDYVKEALARLDGAGHIAYVVGGSVRDFLLGRDARETKDHDIATSAGPDELCRLFPGALEVGKAFGVIKVPVGSSKLLEIATFREDLEYVDHRHPKSVRFCGPSEDAKRRDFTINSFFYDPKSQRVLDFTTGEEDLRKRVIRAIGDPEERFREDALRLLRAVRFTANLSPLGFQLEGGTARAIQARAKLIQHVSAERVRDELNLMLTGPAPDQALELLASLGLLKYVLPELEPLRGLEQAPIYRTDGKRLDVWGHTALILRTLVKQLHVRPAPLMWAALLHDVGKYAASERSGGKNFNGHEIDGVRIAAAIGERLRMPRAEIDRVCAMIQEHLKFRDVFKMREATLERFVREPWFEELLAFHRADAIASDGNLAFYEFCLSRYQAYRQAVAAGQDRGARLLDGNDLIQLGFSPGPEFSGILRTVEDLALERKLTTKEQALEYVVRNFVR